ncbi:zinc finger protein GLIS2 [Lingula anatina]|uniref:Zinc finger protein GLIS2 n=1 Tax=Lingula anatina TaxID=7574 RepID=A0A1S3GYE6_LINAN|nr:zinc finger protein GLIS2 [Lingula anatina]|eukprot:XP_013378895.1 zinc finger protein GLIS2 [Lingula anatina]
MDGIDDDSGYHDHSSTTMFPGIKKRILDGYYDNLGLTEPEDLSLSCVTGPCEDVETVEEEIVADGSHLDSLEHTSLSSAGVTFDASRHHQVIITNPNTIRNNSHRATPTDQSGQNNEAGSELLIPMTVTIHEQCPVNCQSDNLNPPPGREGSDEGNGLCANDDHVLSTPTGINVVNSNIKTARNTVTSSERDQTLIVTTESATGENSVKINLIQSSAVIEGSTSVLPSMLRTHPTILRSHLGNRAEETIMHLPGVQSSHNPMQPVCLKLFYPPPSVLPDSRASLQEEPHECRWAGCKKNVDRLDELVNHVNDDHVRADRDTDNDYKCRWEGCPRKGKGFNARYKMLIHVRTHTNEKPHKCHLCGKSFSRVENLKIHNRSHTGEKPYICPVEGCNKAYSNSSDRFKHVRTHQEDKPYYCKYPSCNKRYTDPSSLRKHIKTNSHYFRGGDIVNNHHTSNIPPHHPMPKMMDNHQSMLLPTVFPHHPAAGLPVSYGGGGGNGLLNPTASLPAHHVISIQSSMLPLSTLASNPLLSSAVIALSGPVTQSISTQTDRMVSSTDSNTSESPKNLSTDTEMLDEDVDETKCQDTPLDLSTSPILAHDSNHGDSNHSDPVGSGYSSKWELINTD